MRERESKRMRETRRERERERERERSCKKCGGKERYLFIVRERDSLMCCQRKMLVSFR